MTRASPAVNAETIYDLASLTKPVVTATLAAQEIEAGRLALDASVGVYLPEWNRGPNREWREQSNDRALASAFERPSARTQTISRPPNRRRNCSSAFLRSRSSTSRAQIRILRPRFHFAGRNSRADHRPALDELATRAHFSAARDACDDVSAAKDTLRAHRADGRRSHVSQAAASRRSPRRKCFRDGRCRRARRVIFDGGRPGSLRADDAQWRDLRTPTRAAPRHRRRLHVAALTFAPHPHTRLGCADGEFLERPFFFGAQLWPYRLYGHFALDRSRKAALCCVADQPRASDTPERQARADPARRA